MDGTASTVGVSIALDKETLEAAVAVRHPAVPEQVAALTPTMARHVAALLLHAADMIEEGQTTDRLMVADGLSREERVALLSDLYKTRIAHAPRKPEPTPRQETEGAGEGQE